MKFLSICSGIDAASVAWNPLGWKAVGFSEIEPFPCAVLKHHYPEVQNFGDMTRFMEWPDANVDVLCGGTPCQSFSVAGLRKGLDDPRGNLMLTFLAVAKRYRPKWVVWENVPGVLSSNGGRDFGSFLGGLAELGYGFAYRVLDARYFGVPQRRRRVFVVGYLGNWRPAAAVLFERESLSGNTASNREEREELAKCLTRGASQRYDTETETMIPVCPQAFDWQSGGDSRGLDPKDTAQLQRPQVPALMLPIGTDCYNGAITGDVAATLGTPGSSVNASEPTVMQSVLAPTLTASNDPSRSPQSSEITAQVAAVVQATAVAFDTYNQAVNAHTSQTIKSPQGAVQESVGTVLQAMQVRRLTPVECERLMGFPDSYTAIRWRGKPASECPDGPRYKAIGNSWAVPVVRWIGERISKFEAWTS